MPRRRAARSAVLRRRRVACSAVPRRRVARVHESVPWRFLPWRFPLLAVLEAVTLEEKEWFEDMKEKEKRGRRWWLW